MVADIYGAFLLGLTFSNIWICALVIFSLQTSSKKISIGYILGRFIGILFLVLLFHLIGKSVRVSEIMINVFSGITMLIFSVYFIIRFSRQSIKKESDWKSRKLMEKCEHNCKSCIISQMTDIFKYCESCNDGSRSCCSEDIQIEPITREARRLWGKNTSKEEEKSGFFAGIMFGVLRGAAMCGRLAILFPLTIKSSIFDSLIIGTIFALSSSIYPIFAIILGEQILKLVKYRSTMVYINFVFLVIISAYYFYHAFLLLI